LELKKGEGQDGQSVPAHDDIRLRNTDIPQTEPVLRTNPRAVSPSCSPPEGPAELEYELVAEGLEGQKVAASEGALPGRNVQRKRVFAPRLRDFMQAAWPPPRLG